VAAYVIGEVEIHDMDAYRPYAEGVPATIAKYGGRYLVRGGAVETMEGGWSPTRVVVLEFPSMEQARRWYQSPEYAPLLALRLRAASARIVFVEGLAG
jgi:uncharacterized protein (DUF1330 family)